jgi:hypothetical protein
MNYAEIALGTWTDGRNARGDKRYGEFGRRKGASKFLAEHPAEKIVVENNRTTGVQTSSCVIAADIAVVERISSHRNLNFCLTT